ncbi:MAG: GAF domain-containing protein [Alkalinema sp. RL_2_19]|nr:GAF domain-containing protein [Alkalinema sp. RL_2_19]
MSQRFIFETLLQTISSSFNIDRCVIVTRSPERPTTWQVMVQIEPGQPATWPIAVALPDCKAGPQVVLNTVLQSRGVIVIQDQLEGHPFLADPYWQSRSPQPSICIPFSYQNQILGAIYLEQLIRAPDRREDPTPNVSDLWNAQQIALLKGICSQAAMSLYYCQQNYCQQNHCQENYCQQTDGIAPATILSPIATTPGSGPKPGTPAAPHPPIHCQSHAPSRR